MTPGRGQAFAHLHLLLAAYLTQILGQVNDTLLFRGLRKTLFESRGLQAHCAAALAIRIPARDLAMLNPAEPC